MAALRELPHPPVIATPRTRLSSPQDNTSRPAPLLPLAGHFFATATESFCIRDAKGQALAYVYYEDETGRRMAMNRLTKDEARRIAVNIAKLPDLLKRPQY